MLNNVIIKDENAVICKDFNYPSVNWSTLTGNGKGQRLIDFAKDVFLWKLLKIPPSSNNILYLVFTHITKLSGKTLALKVDQSLGGLKREICLLGAVLGFRTLLSVFFFNLSG